MVVRRLRILPDPPAHLEPIARETWVKVGQHLIDAQVLTALDLATFEVLCETFSTFRHLKEDIARERRQHGGVPGNPGTRSTATALRLLNQTALSVARLSQEFGLSPSGRARLGTSATAPPASSKFAGLLGGDDE
jgi:P27 family predicted phage terminase small subunit